MRLQKDLIFLLGVLAFFLPFFVFDKVFDAYYQFNLEHGLLMSFIKFAILATLGEVIGLRIKTGSYHQPGFGLIPRALVWGFLGMTIYAAFAIFAAGTPLFLEKLGLDEAGALRHSQLSWK